MTSVTARGNAGYTVEIGPIDIHMLKKQKESLVEMIWDDMDNSLWGVVYMLDDICDAIEDEE